MYIYTCIRTFNEDNSILSSFSPLLFLLFFFLLSLCATMAKKMLLEHYRCAGVILSGV